ncbi:MAG: enoyl-CoA hydratase/isomerase family protein, partial [Rhodobacteraceae bacterium]|nr:enoyl-CoA hydratase/isomerase family protein [Paracoccaceae bacterium]
MSDFTYDVDSDGVATITWDCKDKSMNIMSFQGFDDLDGLVQTALNDDNVKGVIITSGKDSFAAGMDLNVLARLKEESGDNPAQGLFDGLMHMHAILRKIERAGMDPKTNKGGKPIACAMQGTGMGIGFEIPLTGHRLVAADNPNAKSGLRESIVGLFPRAGGTS